MVGDGGLAVISEFNPLKSHEDPVAVNALAYTVGRDVVFGAGQHAPETSEGRRLMAHELTHVAQQSGLDGSLQQSTIMSRHSDPTEVEADITASRIVAGLSAVIITPLSVATIQRQDDNGELLADDVSAISPTLIGPFFRPPRPPVFPGPLSPMICGRELNYPALRMVFGHAYVESPPNRYAIIAPLCTPKDSGDNDFLAGTAARKWDTSPDPCDLPRQCVPCQPKPGVTDVAKCLRDAFDKYNIPTFHKATGPNSNTLAGTMARTCCTGMEVAPFTGSYPGWDDPPAPKREATCPPGPPECK